MIASYEYEHNDGDQIWSDTTEFYKGKDTNTFIKNIKKDIQERFLIVVFF